MGLTATPKETRAVSTLTYFGDPVYEYSLKQGIDDGFLAPYKVVGIDLDRDLQGWRPPEGMTDDPGQEIEDRFYNQTDTNRRPRNPPPRGSGQALVHDHGLQEGDGTVRRPDFDGAPVVVYEPPRWSTSPGRTDARRPRPPM